MHVRMLTSDMKHLMPHAVLIPEDHILRHMGIFSPHLLHGRSHKILPMIPAFEGKASALKELPSYSDGYNAFIITDHFIIKLSWDAILHWSATLKSHQVLYFDHLTTGEINFSLHAFSNKMDTIMGLGFSVFFIETLYCCSQ